MNHVRREVLFDALILLVVGLAQTTYMLGIGVGPVPTLIIGIALISIGVVTIVPSNARSSAAATGILGVVLAGAVVPRYAARAVRAGETLWLSLLLAGLVLLVTFAVLRITTFRSKATPPA